MTIIARLLVMRFWTYLAVAVIIGIVASLVGSGFLIFIFVLALIGGIAYLLQPGKQSSSSSPQTHKPTASPPRFPYRQPPPLPPEERQRKSKPTVPLQWVPLNRKTDILGYNLPGGFYMASEIDHWTGEPSTITLNDTISTPAPPNVFSGSYYPAYTNILPSERAGYLEWLSRDLTDTSPELRERGYLFIYFYGIERRILIDGDLDPALLTRVQQLLAQYGPHNQRSSFISYLSDFLHHIGYQMGSQTYRTLWPQYIPLHEGKVSETALTLVLANLYKCEESLDWSMAYRIAKLHDNAKRSVVTQRSGERFHQLFRVKFEEVYPDGLTLKAGKRDKLVRYQSANGSINPRYASGSYSASAFQISVPNVYALKGQFKKLSLIWNACIDELSGYSRAIRSISEHHDPGLELKMKAYLALPEALRENEEHPLRAEYDALVAVAEKAGNVTIIPCSAFARMIGIEERVTLTKAQSFKVAEFVASLGLSCAPNPAHIELPLRWDQDLAICPSPTQLDHECPKLRGALRLLYLTVMVAAADGDVAEEELTLLTQSLAALDFTDDQNKEIGATLTALLRDTNLTLKNLNRIAKSIVAENRLPVFNHLVAVAAADEIITSDERRILLRIQKAMGLKEGTLESILTDTIEFNTVQVSTASKRNKGEAIPVKKEDTAPVDFSLDMSKIEDITKETKSVIAILAEVLSEDEEQLSQDPAVASDENETDSTPEWMEDLDSIYRQPLLELLRHPAPNLKDIEKIATTHHIMHTALIDEVNEWSDENLGDFIIELDGDTIEIYKELIPNITDIAA